MLTAIKKCIAYLTSKFLLKNKKKIFTNATFLWFLRQISVSLGKLFQREKWYKIFYICFGIQTTRFNSDIKQILMLFYSKYPHFWQINIIFTSFKDILTFEISFYQSKSNNYLTFYSEMSTYSTLTLFSSSIIHVFWFVHQSKLTHFDSDWDLLPDSN